MRFGMVGLGRMGANMARRAMRAGHEVVGFDLDAEQVRALEADGAIGAGSMRELIDLLAAPRVICVMVPAAVVDRTLEQLTPLLDAGDVAVDGGNSSFRDDRRRFELLAGRGVHYVDMGVSGGVFGLDRGYCLMLGGEPEAVAMLEPLLEALAPGVDAAPRTPGRERAGTAERGWLHCGPAGAGHFVKMVHNGIEYGLMAAYAEGFDLLRHASAGLREGDADAETAPLREPELYGYELDIAEIAELWRRGSVISSWLLDLTAQALARSPELEPYSGRVSDSGEGRWTVEAAVETGTPVPVLSAALFSRFASRGEGDFANRVLSAMRHAFGGHLERDV